MSYQDRYSPHDSQKDHFSPLNWFWRGSLPAGIFAGLRVKIHSTFLLLIALVLFLGPAAWPILDRVVFLAMLLVAVAMHEIGHALVLHKLAAGVGEVILWPLGELSEPPPRRPADAFTLALAGPAINLMVCALAAGALHLFCKATIPLWPQLWTLAPGTATETRFYLWHLYNASASVLLINLLPALPLDAARMLHAGFWSRIGYARAMLATCDAGIATSLTVGAWAIYAAKWWVLSAMVLCLIYSLQRRAQIKLAGLASFEDYDLEVHLPRRHHLGRFLKWRARRQIRREEADSLRLDAILKKITTQGLRSLTWAERRVLRHATDRQRQRESADRPA